MTDNSQEASARRDLLDRIDALLWADTYANDVRSTALIGLELGELIRGDLDDLQRNALDVAKTYWTAGAQNEPEWLDYGGKIGRRQDEHAHSGTHRTRAAYANTVVYVGLNDRTGLSGFAGEFLVEIGIGGKMASRLAMLVAASLTGQTMNVWFDNVQTGTNCSDFATWELAVARWVYLSG